MKYIFAGILLLVACIGQGQSVLKFTDYGVARPLINPAYMGVETGVNGLALYRSRFEKSDYWPSLGAFNINSSIKDKNLGGGLSVMFNKYGPYQKLFAYVAGSYKLKVNEGKYLYFGIQAGLNYVSNSNDYNKADPEEVIFSDSYSQPNFGFGVHYQSEKFFGGFSIPEFKYNTIDNEGNKVNEMVSEFLKIYMYAGYKFKLSANVSLTPYSYMSYSEQDELQMDLGARLGYKESIEFGAQFRTKEAFALTARVKLFEELWLGYSFEGNNAELDNSFNSTQEITLTFRFGKKGAKKEAATTPTGDSFDDNINSIRYF